MPSWPPSEVALRKRDPNRVVGKLRTVQNFKQSSYSSDSLMAVTLSVVTGLVLIFSALGIFGLATFNVNTRTRQIGTRRAVGARKRDIVSYFMAENWMVTTLGVRGGLRPGARRRLLAVEPVRTAATRPLLPRGRRGRPLGPGAAGGVAARIAGGQGISRHGHSKCLTPTSNLPHVQKCPVPCNPMAYPGVLRMTSVTSHVEDRLAHRTVLVADDSEAVRTAFQVLLSLHGARVLGASSPAEALATVRSQEVDLIIQDMNFRREATSGEEGVALFQELRALHPDVPVILLTAWTHLETAVDLVKAGAADYIAKPWDDARLLTTVRNLLELRAAVEENVATRARRAEARAQLAERYDLRGLVYESDALHTVATMAAQVAHADVPVLITGPNGAGKEVLADIVHANSARKTQPYVKVNAGALPDQLIEAELFGTEAGAFTGAKARAGRFEAADGGTLFLDEIGNLPLAGQAKLLRVLQTGEYERLGQQHHAARQRAHRRRHQHAAARRHA